MRKITDFIVEKRNYILIIFIILSGICLFLSSKVKINYDLTRYLPDDSSTKIGVDIMNDEFSSDTSSLSIMFKDLKNNEKNSVKEYLINIDGVSEVLYDESSQYNKDGYTLYKLTIDDKADSKTASKIYDNIKDKYEDYDFYTSGDVSTYNAPVLSIWVVILAICSAMVIMIIMCESYVEPFLFLFVIGLAVFLNKGTNIFFPSVSNITNSICAILQMALSMDYSIMLMNRYKQEKENYKDNKEAMKEALYHSFLSISSSSVTTIVGLLALVFMSFTIGVDLGLVLAKGVVFSLVSIFFVLPSLILLFDKLIDKTRKKHFNISLNLLGKFSYFLRRGSIVIFIIIFAGSFLLKSNIKYEFTGAENDKVKEIFGSDNQIALVYNNKEEKFFADYCSKLNNDKRFSEVLCYANTLSEGLKYNELNDKFNELSVSVNFDEELVKVLYYYYYNRNIDNKMSYNEFTTFMLNTVLKNPDYAKQVNDNLKSNLNKLPYFTNSNEILTKRSYSQIANILGLSNGTVQSLFALYNSANPQSKITLPEFYNFITNNILTNKTYASMISNEDINKLNTMALYLDNNKNNTVLDAQNMAKLFNMDTSLVESVYKYYNFLIEPQEKLSLYDFSNFTLSNVVTNPEYADSFNEESITKLNKIRTLADPNITSVPLGVNDLASALGIDSTKVTMVLGLYNRVNNKTETTMSIETFTSFLLSYKDNELIKNYLDEATINSLLYADTIIKSSMNKEVYDYKEISSMLGFDAKNIYTLYQMSTNYISEISPKAFITFILANKNLTSNLDENALYNLNLVNMIMNAVENNQTFNAKEMSDFLNIDQSNINLMYSLYDTNNNLVKYSLYEFINFVLTKVVTNPTYSNLFNSANINSLKAINGIMTSSINNVKYTYKELANNLSSLAGNVDSKQLSLVYLLYGTNNNYDDNYALSIEQLISYLNEDIITDSRFTPFIEEDMLETIKDSNSLVSSSKELLVGDKYSRIVLTTKLDNEDKEIFDFIKNTKKDIDKKDAYLAGDAAMAYEMSESFNGELNLITVLTMLFIFVVVAISFKSILIPLILVLLIECAVFITMDIITFENDPVYFIAVLIVQSILMGATIDYAILYTSYYIEHRKSMDIKEALINSYNKSFHTILTSASILIIVTLIVGNFASAIAAKICITISKGTLCSALLIFLILPSLLAAFDKLIMKKRKV